MLLEPRRSQTRSIHDGDIPLVIYLPAQPNNYLTRMAAVVPRSSARQVPAVPATQRYCL